MIIQAGGMPYRQLNERIRQAADDHIVIEDCLGQRYIASGLADKEIVIHGTPGNGLGAYLDGATIVVHGNAQDATGDTMNDGAIYIHGSCGDGAGYAMRGGCIFIEGDVGYRAGIHMKAYRGKQPALVIGGRAGSFLGEYQAGGVILVLNRGHEQEGCSSHFCAAGMHGGKILVRSAVPPDGLPSQVTVRPASRADCAEIDSLLAAFAQVFGHDPADLRAPGFYVITPDTKNPYKQLYTPN